MDGVGFVFLESRARDENVDNRAGIALRYGYGRGHHHQDNLNIEMFSRGLSVSPELGYPNWTHPMGNTGHVAHHCTGMIDRSPQYRNSIARGNLEMFASAPEASFADVSARPDGFPNRMYRRAVCLADAPDNNVYLLDILRLAGGYTRTYCFHGPPCDDFQSNVKFGPSAPDIFPIDGFGTYESNIIEPQIAVSGRDVWGDWKYLGRDVRMRVSLLGATGRSYITARCAKTDLPPIRYLFAEDASGDGMSEFIALWQPYEGKPFIENMIRLPLDYTGSAEAGPVAIRVTLTGGREDTFFYSLNPDVELHCGEISFRGSFGYWSETGGKLRALHLVNGGCLHKGNQGIKESPPPFRATITAVDYDRNVITLSRELPPNTGSTGQLIFFRENPHRAAYHIAEVLPSRTAVRLDMNPIIYRSGLVKIGGDRHHIECELSPSIETSQGFRPGYYDGATLTGEDKKGKLRVARVEDNRIFFDRSVDETDFPDADKDGRRMVNMYEIGPNDEAVIYHSIFKTV
jgi:hypothetical protein